MNKDDNMEIGDLVKWYSLYNDGIVKDAGYGILVEKHPNGDSVYSLLNPKTGKIEVYCKSCVEVCDENW